MTREWIILADDREKKPLLFPEHLVCLDHSAPATSGKVCTVRLVVRRARLSFGDYLLASHPGACVIERKSSLAEIAVNCLSPSRRPNFLKNLADLRTVAHPHLLFEGSPSRVEPLEGLDHPESAMDALLDLLLSHRISHSVLPSATIGQRQEAGRYAARLLIRGALSCPSPAPAMPPSPDSFAGRSPLAVSPSPPFPAPSPS